MKKMKFDLEFIREWKSNKEFIDKLKSYQIIALEDNPQHGVKKGDRGGKVIVQFDNQLEQLRIEDTSWVMKDAYISLYRDGNLTIRDNSVIKSGLLRPALQEIERDEWKGDSLISNSIIEEKVPPIGFLDVEGLTYIEGRFTIKDSVIRESHISPLTEVTIIGCQINRASIAKGIYTNCTIDNSRVHGIISDSIIKDTIGFSTLSYHMGGKLCHSKEGVSGLQVINDIVSVR